MDLFLAEDGLSWPLGEKRFRKDIFRLLFDAGVDKAGLDEAGDDVDENVNHDCGDGDTGAGGILWMIRGGGGGGGDKCNGADKLSSNMP